MQRPYDAEVQSPLPHAATALGWHGTVLPDVPVLDQRVAAVVRVREDVHRWRATHGWPPLSEPSWFTSWFEPAGHDQLPVAAVDLVGLFVCEAAADGALQSCGTLLSLAPCAVVLPGEQGTESWPLLELDYYGVGVVTVDADQRTQVLVRPEDRSVEFGPSLYGRWLLEVLYQRLLELTPDTTRPVTPLRRD